MTAQTSQNVPITICKKHATLFIILVQHDHARFSIDELQFIVISQTTEYVQHLVLVFRDATRQSDSRQQELETTKMLLVAIVSSCLDLQ